MILILLFLTVSVVATLLGEVYVAGFAAIMVALSMLTSAVVFRFLGQPKKS
jgi:hypothetical protein